jgi:hypothetical protein
VRDHRHEPALVHTQKTPPTGVISVASSTNESYWAVGGAAQIRGVNKKGKDFFKFKTNLTETIHNVRVCDLQVSPSPRGKCGWVGAAACSIKSTDYGLRCRLDPRTSRCLEHALDRFAFVTKSTGGSQN